MALYFPMNFISYAPFSFVLGLTTANIISLTSVGVFRVYVFGTYFGAFEKRISRPL